VTRRFARELALQTLFSIDVGKHDAAEALDDALGRTDIGEQRGFVSDLVLGSIEHAATLDALIAPLLQEWTLDRLPTVDRLVLRMGAFEILYRPETPRPVVLNEAVELAKKFSTEASGRFVNGVLSNVGNVA
jgi:N utilization substance protein B